MKADIWDCGARAELQSGQQGGCWLPEAQLPVAQAATVRQVLIVLISADISVIHLTNRK